MTDPLRRMNPATVIRDLYEAQGEPLPGPLERMSKQDTMKKLGLDPRRSWQKETQVAIAEGSGGGSNSPDWVPTDAIIHIDLVNVRAWTSTDGEVAIDTLLGADANTENGWAVSVYDDMKLSADGYGSTVEDSIVALIGAARSKLFDDATVVLKFKQVANEVLGEHCNLGVISADGNFGIDTEIDGGGTDKGIHTESWGGDLFVEILGVVNYIDGGGALNSVALTLTTDRFDLACNGATAVSAVLTPDDYPVSGDSPLVAAVIEVGTGKACQSITLYDALPDTTGLSALSETSVTNTAPHDIVNVGWGADIVDGVTSQTFADATPENRYNALGATATDDDGNPLTWSLTDDDSGKFIVVTGGDGSGSVYIVAPLSVGAHDFTLRATDLGGLYVEQEFTLTVCVSLDFVNEVYSHTLTDVLESEVSNAGVVFDATKIVNGTGYLQTAGSNYGGRFKGAVGALLYSGARIVMEFEIIDDALPTTVGWEWFDEPDYNTDLLTNTGTAQRRIRDFGSGGVNVTGAGLAEGVHTAEIVRTASVFSLTVDDVLVGTGTPVIPVAIDEVYFSMSGPTGSIAVRKIEIFAP